MKRLLSGISLLFSALIGIAVLGGLVFFASGGFKPDSIDAVAPPRVAQADDIPLRPSVINVPVSVPISRVREELGANVPNKLLEINERRNKCIDQKVDLIVTQTAITLACKIEGVIRKDGELQISSGDGKLNVVLPIKFRITVTALDGILKGQSETVEGSLTVNADLVPRLKPNWTFAVNADANFRWRDRAHADVFGFRLDFADQLRPEIQKALDGLGPELAKMLNDLNLKQTVARAWRDLQQPFKVSDGPAIWVAVTPRSVHFSGLRIGTNTISANVALRVETQTRIGSKPDVTVDRTLPNLRDVGNLPEGFEISLPVTVSYRAIERQLASAKLGNRIVEVVDPNEYTLELSKYDVYPSDKAIVIGFDYVADAPGPLFDATGRAYLSAVPQVNWRNKDIRFRDMHFASVADNVVVDAASFIVSQRPVMQIAEDNAFIPFKAEYDELVKNLDDALDNQLEGGVSTQGNLIEANVDNVQFAEDGIRLIVTLKGDLNVRLQ
ncbi:MAG: DUF4403 family protein [Hyphomicrobiaceae bacterium]|nr:DUF4403 family protein [Hyphomicrobiaceae bacterium]MCC0024735.1 DUF4403 family protein [Hyphomicrobiaceae bacterium]